MAKFDVKRLLVMSGMGATALIFTGGLMYMASTSGSSGGDSTATSAPASHQLGESSNRTAVKLDQDTGSQDSQPEVSEGAEDPPEVYITLEDVSSINLERLRERERELTTIYEGAAPTQYLGSPDDEVIISPTGSLSDFDKRPEAESTDIVKDSLTDSISPSTDEPQSADQALNDTLSIEPQDEEQEDWTQLEPDPSDSLDSLTPIVESEQRTTPSVFGEVGAMRRLDEIESSMAVLQLSVDHLHERSNSLSSIDILSIRESIDSLHQELESINERLNSDDNRLSSAEVAEAVETKLAAYDEQMSARLTSLEERSATTGNRAPARNVDVTNLYEILSIEHQVVVLKGRNTGKVYRLRRGDSLAYGGTLSEIRGDTAVLNWPNQQVVLSVF